MKVGYFVLYEIILTDRVIVGEMGVDIHIYSSTTANDKINLVRQAILNLLPFTITVDEIKIKSLSRI